METFSNRFGSPHFRRFIALGTAATMAGLVGCNSSGVAPSKTASGAGTGALIGGAGGAIAGNNSSMGTGTGLVGGAAAGALIGGIVGMVQDAKDRKEQDRLAQERDGKVTKGELYLAHLLGSAGASRLLKLVDERPQESAANAFQAAAKANKSVFYAADKRKYATVAEVHARISEMIERRVMRYAGAKEQPRSGLRLSSADPMQSVHGGVGAR